MNAILKQTLELAEAKLGEREQARLAELVGEAVENWSAPVSFSPEELEHLRMVASEPFEPADPKEVKTLFEKARV